MAEMDYSQLMQVLGTRPAAAVQRPMSAKQAGDLAFHTQMQMALNLFSDGKESQAGQSHLMGGSLMNDALMMDALSTISRLIGENPLERSQPMNVVRAKVPEPQKNALVAGALSAMFESGDKGVEAIGFDRVGGTSYGKFQIASRTGSMHDFLKFLDERAPEWSKRLRAAGPANTGGTRGGMPREWKKIAEESPERFELLQREFIREDHYQPAREKIIAQTGIDVDKLPLAAREVLWSTAVQHGATGAAEIFGQAIAGLHAKPDSGEFVHKLIDEVYDNRKTQFGSSSRRVRASVQSRMDHEKRMALAMLDTGSVNMLA
ncbi:VgrG-related protein [Paucidesulfovibrio longus]|uniref:VgrG-related protein n=1 Tax=Paucidesulfovibrio longus TaxID=889 RepID=UPI0003B399E3|nr:hypothetical protein [Paucidesulfovibrio longus]